MTITYLVAPVAMAEITEQFTARLLQTFITFLPLNTNAFTNVFVNKYVDRRSHKLIQDNTVFKCQNYPLINCLNARLLVTNVTSF